MAARWKADIPQRLTNTKKVGIVSFTHSSAPLRVYPRNSLPPCIRRVSGSVFGRPDAEPVGSSCQGEDEMKKRALLALLAWAAVANLRCTGWCLSCIS